MTFSLIGRCARTGMFGVIVTSSSVCVASRCAWVKTWSILKMALFMLTGTVLDAT